LEELQRAAGTIPPEVGRIPKKVGRIAGLFAHSPSPEPIFPIKIERRSALFQRKVIKMPYSYTVPFKRQQIAEFPSLEKVSRIRGPAW